MIHDEFTALPLSRQRKKQLRWIRDGKCKLCGRKRDCRSAQFCPSHLVSWRRYISDYMVKRLKEIYGS